MSSAQKWLFKTKLKIELFPDHYTITIVDVIKYKKEKYIWGYFKKNFKVKSRRIIFMAPPPKAWQWPQQEIKVSTWDSNSGCRCEGLASYPPSATIWPLHQPDCLDLSKVKLGLVFSFNNKIKLSEDNGEVVMVVTKAEVKTFINKEPRVLRQTALQQLLSAGKGHFDQPLH